MQLRPALAFDAPGVVASRQRLGAKVARHAEQFADLDPPMATHARDRRSARRITRREILHDGGAKARLVVEHEMIDAEPVGDAPRIVNVLAGAAGALSAGRRAMVVELQG